MHGQCNLGSNKRLEESNQICAWYSQLWMKNWAHYRVGEWWLGYRYLHR
jgi:hypothetical protein